MYKAIFSLILVVIFNFKATFSHGQEFKLMTYNALAFYSTSTDRIPYFKMIMDSVQPDIVVFQELISNASLQVLLNGAFSNAYSAGTFIDGPDTDRGLCYRNDKFSFVSNTIIPTSLRDINMYTLVHLATNDTIRIFGVHLKASSGEENEAARLSEVISLRNVTNQFSSSQHFIICGDFNFYGSFEPAYQKLIENQGTNFGHVIDPVTLTGTWNNPAYAQFHTQSPRTRSFGGGVTGGLDDRFDLILYSQSISFSGGLDYVSNSLWPVGNDGNHHNDSINQMPNSRVSLELATAIHNAADHLPVVATFKFPTNSLEDLSSQAIRIYPNPAQTSFYVDAGVNQLQKIEIYTILGEQIFSEKPNTNTLQIDIEAINPGIYFVKIEVDSQTFIEKIEILHK
jgi:exonuclease III